MKSPFALNRSIKVRYSFALILCVFISALTVMAGPTDLDPTFGNLGKVVSSPDGSQAIQGRSMALQPDGKIVMIGSRLNGSSASQFIVARYNADGSLDTTFNNIGWNSANFEGYSFQSATDVDIQADGKIVVGGNVQLFINQTLIYYFGIARFNSNGSIDTTFDTDGELVFQASSVFHTAAHLDALKVAGDGKIVVAGTVLTSGFDNRFVAAKINPDGSFVSTFGDNGRFVDQSNGPSNHDLLSDMAILPDGTFIVVGFLFNPSFSAGIAIKYGINGGRLWTYLRSAPTWPNRTESLNGIVSLPDGKFIVVGRRANKVSAVRLNADGTQDNTFVNAAGTPNGEAISVGVQSDGKIVANIAPESPASGSGFSLVRYNPNGSLDTGFGTGGIHYAVGSDAGRKLLIQPDGKILVGGSVVQDSGPHISIVRYRGGTFVAEKPQFDYDGDRKSDVSVYRPSQGTWYLNQSANGFASVPFGNSTDRIVPADYDGDGKADIAVYRDGGWWIFQSSNGVFRFGQFGLAEDKPQPGDFDEDGRDDLAVFRPSSGVWYVLRSSDGGFTVNAFGANGDIPQRGDYDDDDRTDFAVFRPSTGYWYVLKSSGGTFITQFGLNGDVPVANDYDGDSKPDIAVWRPSNGTWYILRSSDNQYFGLEFGITTDVPVAADYDGDGRADIAVFRPSTGAWFQRLSTQGPSYQVFGLSTDRPTPSAYNP